MLRGKKSIWRRTGLDYDVTKYEGDVNICVESFVSFSSELS